MLEFFVEFLGTFIFLYCILAIGQPIPIAIALLAAIYFGGHISGGHYNPAVSTMMFAKGGLPIEKYTGYIVAQLVGAFAALAFYKATSKYLTAKQ